MTRHAAALCAAAALLLAACGRGSPTGEPTARTTATALTPSPTEETEVSVEIPTFETTAEPPPDSAPTEPRDPCHDISEEDIEAAAGFAVDRVPQPGGASCTFTGTDDPTRTVVMKHERSGTDLNTAREAVESSFDVTPSAVGGVGEDAFSFVYELPGGLVIAGVVARERDRVVNVAVSGPDSFAAVESATAVARVLIEAQA